MLLPPINDDRKIHLEFNIEMFPFNATRYQFETFSLDFEIPRMDSGFMCATHSVLWIYIKLPLTQLCFDNRTAKSS